MATYEDVDKMVVRLVGDDSHYQDTLLASRSGTKKWNNEVIKIVQDNADQVRAIRKKQLEDIKSAPFGPDLSATLASINKDSEEAIKNLNKQAIEGLRGVEVAMRRAERQARVFRRSLTTGLKVGLGLFGFSGAIASLKLFKDSWQQVTKEIENAEAASQNFTLDQIEAIQDAQQEVSKLTAEWRRFKRELGTAGAGTIGGGADIAADVFSKVRLGLSEILVILQGIGEAGSFEEIGDRRRALAEDEGRRIQAGAFALTPEELKEKEFREKTIKNAMEGQVEAIDELKAKLGNISEEQLAVNNLMREAGDSAKRIGVQHEEALKKLVSQRLELEKQLKQRQEQERLAKEAAREEERRIEASNRAIARANERRMKEADKRNNEGLDLIRERALLQGERLDVIKQLEEIRASGVPISAGAAIEAGSVEGRSLTKFGTSGETMTKLLQKLQSIEEQELRVQEKTLRGIEVIKDNPTITVTIA